MNQDVQTIICFFLNCEDVASFGTRAKSSPLLENIKDAPFDSDFPQFPPYAYLMERPTAFALALESHHVAALADAEDAVACVGTGAPPPQASGSESKWFCLGWYVRLQVFNCETERSNEFKMSCYTVSVTFRRISEGYIYSRNGEPLGSMESV